MLRQSAGGLAALGLAVALFGTSRRLHGPLLYDDKAAVMRNPVVTGQVPLSRVWLVDFWGEHELALPNSHKSFRPLVTLTYRSVPVASLPVLTLSVPPVPATQGKLCPSRDRAIWLPRGERGTTRHRLRPRGADLARGVGLGG